jgi:hypothetical protein
MKTLISSQDERKRLCSMCKFCINTDLQKDKWLCKKEPSIDVLDGQIIYGSCYDTRRYTQFCGVLGDWWEPKKETEYERVKREQLYMY